MTAVAVRFTEPRYLAALGVLLIGAGLGTLAGYDPKLAIAAAIGMAFLLVAVGDLAAGIAVFAVLTYLELSPVAGGPALSFAKLAGLALVISWVASLSSARIKEKLLFVVHPALFASLVFFVAWTAVTGLWAEDTGATWLSVARYALAVMIVPIVFTGISEPRHMRWVAAGIVAGSGFAAVYGVVVAPSISDGGGDLNRVSGTIGDPNVLASVLVVGFVMAMAFAVDAGRSQIVRVLAAGVAFANLVAIFATVSRGGIIALAAALVASVVLAGPRRGRMTLAVATAAVVAVGYFSFFAAESQIDRLTNADGGAGRTDIWRIGWRMVEDSPVHGIGSGNFNISSIHYLLVEPGAIERDEFIVDIGSVAHNMYLEILSETGVIGLALFLAAILISLLTAIRAAGRFDRIGEDGLALIARGVAISLISLLAADFFLSAQLSKLLWLLIGLGPAMLAISRRLDQAGATSEPEGRDASSP